jgi:hypothetical protein
LILEIGEVLPDLSVTLVIGADTVSTPYGLLQDEQEVKPFLKCRRHADRVGPAEQKAWIHAAAKISYRERVIRYSGAVEVERWKRCRQLCGRRWKFGARGRWRLEVVVCSG